MKFLFSELKTNPLFQIGLISFLLYCGISYISKGFIYGSGYNDRPIVLFLSLYLSLFVLYFLAIGFVSKSINLRRCGENKINEDSNQVVPVFSNSPFLLNQNKDLIIVLFFAVLFRLALLPSNPIQEDDYYRYMWDGKVALSGINPYKYSPDEIDEFAAYNEKREYTYEEIKELESLNLIRFENSRTETLFDRINHPEVRTIYPPFSQVVFMLSEILFSGKIIGLRIILLGFDLSTLCVLLLLLKQHKLNPVDSITYAWSPLVIKEVVNSLHIESIPLLFLICSLYLLTASRFIPSIFAYSLSILSKYYSAILFPIFFTKMLREGWLKFFTASIILFFTLFVFYFPFVREGWFVFDGLIIYGNQWERNDSLFAVIKYLTGNRQTTSLIIFFLLIAILIYVTYARSGTRTKAKRGLLGISSLMEDTGKKIIIKQILIVLTALFLLSPTQYPWYFISLLPFLTFYKNRALLLLSGLLSLYYLEFYFIYNQIDDPYYLLRWIEYLPFYILLIYDMLVKCEK